MDASKSKRLDLFLVAIASWLILAPFMFGYYREFPGATQNVILMGAIIGVFAILDFELPKWWEEGINLLLGLWLVVSPMVIGFEANSLVLWNTIIPGVLAAAVATWEIALRYFESHNHGGAPPGRRVA